MDMKLDFIEINYQECAEKLLRFPSRVAMFYMEQDELRQIKSGEEFIRVVALQCKVYRQWIVS